MTSPRVVPPSYLSCAALLMLSAACGGDPSSGRSGDAGITSDGSTEDGDAHPTDGDGAVSADAAAPGPAVNVDPRARHSLLLRDVREVCLLNAQGAVACRAPDSSLGVVRDGPFVSFAGNRSGAGCGLTSAGALDCWMNVPGEDALCRADSPDCLHGGVPPSGITWQDVALGETHGCGVTSQGTLQCWGASSDGQLLVPSGSDFVRLAIGDETSCALTSTGVVRCWGDGAGLFEDLTDAVHITMAEDAVCALHTDGTVSCAGWAQSPPKAPAGKQLAQLSMHDDGICTLTSDGQPSCEGFAAITRVTPPPGPFVQITSSASYACGVRGDGQLQCWGDQWGNGAGVETCALFEAKLALNGQPRTFKTSATTWRDTNLLYAPNWRLVTRLEPQHYFQLQGQGTLPRAHSTGKYTPADLFASSGTSTVRASHWLLDASDTSPGAIVCSSGSGGSVRANGDELVVDLKNVATLSCPGRPVDGSITFCTGNSCSRGSGAGSIHGTPWTAVGATPPSLVDDTWLEDGSVLVTRLAPTLATTQWALLFTAPDSPFQGEVICIGAAKYNGTDRPDSFQLSELSVLDPCPANATGTLTGCVR